MARTTCELMDLCERDFRIELDGLSDCHLVILKNHEGPTRYLTFDLDQMERMGRLFLQLAAAQRTAETMGDA